MALWLIDLTSIDDLEGRNISRKIARAKNSEAILARTLNADRDVRAPLYNPCYCGVALSPKCFASEVR